MHTSPTENKIWNICHMYTRTRCFSHRGLLRRVGRHTKTIQNRSKLVLKSPNSMHILKPRLLFFFINAYFVKILMYRNFFRVFASIRLHDVNRGFTSTAFLESERCVQEVYTVNMEVFGGAFENWKSPKIGLCWLMKHSKYNIHILQLYFA